jgi:methyl-accepting chemotaxis protein
MNLERGLAIAFGLIVLLVLAMIPVAFGAMSGISTQAQQLHDKIIAGQLAYVKVLADAETLRAASLDAATNPNPALADTQLSLAHALVAQFPDDARKMSDIFLKNAQHLDAVQKLVKAFNDSASAYDFQALGAVSLLQQNKRAQALVQINGVSSQAYEKQNTDGEQLLAALSASADQRYAELQRARDFGLGFLLLGIVLVGLVSAGTFFIVRRLMMRDIGRCADIFEALGSGDLTQRITWSGGDLLGRLGQSIDGLGERLSATMAQIQRAARTVRTASEHSSRIALEVDGRVKEELAALGEALDYSGDVASSSGAVAENAEAVARRVSDISSAVAQMSASIAEMDQNLLNLATVVEQSVANTQEMSASIVQVAGSAERVRSESTVTDQQVRDGRNEVLALSKGMSSISETVADVVAEMQNLDQASRQIGEILGLIEEIADQTNLLALNAAIEAARAGEHGRGFAVVADEVRKLAENSASSTKQIGKLVSDIQRRTGAVLDRSARANTLVQSNAQSAQTVTAMIEGISKRVTDMAQLVGEISVATTEQARASEELAKASEQMGAMTHEAAATMREQTITSNQILESVSEIEDRTAQVARASTEQQTAVQALGARVGRSTDLGRKNAEAVGSMSSGADEVHAQASSLGELVGQFVTERAGTLEGGNSSPAALGDPGALALSS